VCTADFRADEAEEQAQDTPEENAAEESGDGDAGAEEPAAEEAPEEEAAEEEEEEEPVDPKPEVEESCKPRCVKQLLAYQACEKRVEEEEEGDQKHCTGQYFDYWGCVDKCTAHKLFRKLK
jgi:ubiquinol-cytochrome c reductase subunit 6